MNESDYYTKAFRHMRSEGFRYEGGGTYEKHGSRYRIRTFAEWSANPSVGVVTSTEVGHA